MEAYSQSLNQTQYDRLNRILEADQKCDKIFLKFQQEQAEANRRREQLMNGMQLFVQNAYTTVRTAVLSLPGPLLNLCRLLHLGNHMSLLIMVFIACLQRLICKLLFLTISVGTSGCSWLSY